MIAFSTSTAALWCGKINGENFVYITGVILAGHHAKDCIDAWRKQ